LYDILEEETVGKKKIYCIFELCEKALSHELSRRDKAVPLEKIKKWMRELLISIDILHSKMIMHRDIKPDNILVDRCGRLKIADFGLAKKASFLQRRKSNAIVSLWYRAPEIILGGEDYFLGVDMWSIGCIFAELFCTNPIFMCRNEKEVLTKVFQMLGTPSQTNCPMYLKLRKFKSDDWKPTHKAPGNIKQMFSHVPPQALDLITKMLALDPNKRILAREALNHPFFTQ